MLKNANKNTLLRKIMLVYCWEMLVIVMLTLTIQFITEMLSWFQKDKQLDSV